MSVIRSIREEPWRGPCGALGGGLEVSFSAAEEIAMLDVERVPSYSSLCKMLALRILGSGNS